MKISKKAYYGLRSVTLLAEKCGELSVHEIAKTEGMPEEYLHKILQVLRRANIVSAEKGTSGGYTLTRDSNSISVWDIVVALEGGFTSFAPPRLSASSPYPKLTHCQTNFAWRTLGQTIENTLSQLKISDLISPPTVNI